MRVTFGPDASEELDRIFARIADDNPRAALNMVARILQDSRSAKATKSDCDSQPCERRRT
jgi:plasmid stabilization system protein ParE